VLSETRPTFTGQQRIFFPFSPLLVGVLSETRDKGTVPVERTPTFSPLLVGVLSETGYGRRLTFADVALSVPYWSGCSVKQGRAALALRR